MTNAAVELDDPAAMPLHIFMARHRTGDRVQDAEVRRVWRRARPQGAKARRPTHAPSLFPTGPVRARRVGPANVLPAAALGELLTILKGSFGFGLGIRRARRGRR